MTAYDDLDRSRDSARPAELFEFTGGVLAHYTTSQKAVFYNGYEYSPDFISHGELEITGELNKQSLEITLRGDSPVAQLYVSEIPPVGVDLRVFRFLDGLSEFRLVWAGRVVKSGASGENDECVLTCEPIFTMIARPGLRRNYQIICPYALYDHNCRVSRGSYTETSVIDQAEGNAFSSPAIRARPSGWYVGGILRFGASQKLVIDHQGGRVSLSGAPRALGVGSSVDASAGCDKSLGTCRDKFGNHVNFGGFPWIPTKNPFTGDSLYSI
jgi:uncharacterized phage protein (TIGR02218 family)